MVEILLRHSGPILSLAQKFWEWQGPMNGALSFYDCRFNGGDTMKWWGHSNATL